MAIAGYIGRILPDPQGLTLVLRPRDGQEPTGQPSLVLVDPTWTPEPGMEIWGNDTTVLIEANPQRKYRRIGYRRIVEWDKAYPHGESGPKQCPRCGEWLLHKSDSDCTYQA